MSAERTYTTIKIDSTITVQELCDAARSIKAELWNDFTPGGAGGLVIVKREKRGRRPKVVVNPSTMEWEAPK